ncbi:MAG: helix-turn-helix transcriptional regulator [Sedimenticola sp.]
MMNTLEERLRFLMKRQRLTRQHVSDFVDVSMVTVHKWLSGGDIKDSTAQLLAERMCIDWLWLKHGTTRVPQNIVDLATSNLSDTVLMTTSPGGNSVICAVGSKVPSMLQITDLVGSASSDIYTPEGFLAHKVHLAKSVAGRNSSININGLVITENNQLLDQDVTSTMLTPFTTPDGQGYYLSQVSAGK